MGLNGLLLVDKPADFTSHDVVGRVRRILKQKTVGHTGTLDPMATGLMVLVLGEGTKLSDFLMFSDKEYRLKARLGVTTDTLDRTGKILEQKAVDLSEEQIRQAALSLQGDFEWLVPVFSAAKVEGKKLYEYGRKEIPVEQPVKTMSFEIKEIHRIEPNAIELTIRCSKGSFIRTWAAQLGEKLGVGGHLEELRRTRVGLYTLEQAVTLEQLERLVSENGGLSPEAGGQRPEACDPSFIPLGQTLPDWRSVRVSGKEERLLMNGQIPRDLANRLLPEQKEALRRSEQIGVKVLGSSGGLISILVAQPGYGLKIKRVFRLDPGASNQ